MSSVASSIAVPVEINRYALMSDEECQQRIRIAKEKLGDDLLILGHHYQRDEVFEFSDASGDSLKLSRIAADSSAKYVVFCGVHFMAEVADILTSDEQVAILPDMSAGCSMADMANLANVERCWKELTEVLGEDADKHVTPTTYINSAADLKAFCGRHEGIICTSTNAQHVLEWCFEQREKILFFPDQHLGRNTAFNMGIPLEEMVVWDFDRPYGGLTHAEIKNAKMILWKGFCSVHQMFQPEQVDNFKAKYPETIIIAHPESSFEVCQKADYVGSTEYILNTVRAAEPGTRWLVATELNMVNRLAEQMKEKGVDVHFMSPTVCMCSTMFRIDPQHLCWVLENLVDGKVVNQVKVAPKETEQALYALQKMLDLPI